MSNLPPGLLAVSKTVYVETTDPKLRELPDYEWAQRRAVQYKEEKGRWPTVRQLMNLCVVRRWAAWRGLKTAKEANTE